MSYLVGRGKEMHCVAARLTGIKPILLVADDDDGYAEFHVFVNLF